MAHATDEDLARRAQQGDLEAYGVLAEHCQGPVYAVCYRLLGERREAEDLAQETLLRAYQRLGQYQPGRPFLPWIRAIAAHLCLNRLESRPPEPASLEDERGFPPGSGLPGVEAIHEQAEIGERVRLALSRLPPRYRVVIELRHFQELSYQEIAAELNLPLSDVKSHLFRARRLLAQELGANELES